MIISRMVKIDAQWKIETFYGMADLRTFEIPGFDPEKEQGAIENTVQSYMDGISSGDAKRVENVIDPDFCRVNIGRAGQSGKTVIIRQRNESND
jgi:hypothetical protein